MTGPYLTEVQHRVLRRFAEGATCGNIARELGVSEVTVRGYSMRIRHALDAATLPHAVHRAHQLGLLDDLPRSPRQEVPPQEMQVLRLIASGCTNSEIAARLRRSQYTVAEQVKQVRARLGARDRGHAVALAMDAGLLDGADVRGTSALPPVMHTA